MIERFATYTISTLRGNPHSTSLAAHETSRRIESIRLRLLDYFKADPELFDLVFVANATAGIKLIAEAFHESQDGFWFGYHYTCHTSVIGVREMARNQCCFQSDAEVEKWLQSINRPSSRQNDQKLFAYPSQSNMNGRRLSLDWCRRIRESKNDAIYTLLDAAALVSTSSLNLSDSESSPDFTVLSLYKIFGFPEVGVLIARKAAAHIFRRRKYFGGGAVDMVLCAEKWHARKTDSLHQELEDGSLPIHNILAIEPALETYLELFGPVDRVSRHCGFLAERLYHGLLELRHSNGRSVCQFYHEGGGSAFRDRTRQGPILAFNIRDGKGLWIGTTEVEKLASIKGIQLRTGGLCNPGGVATALRLSPQDMKRNFASGFRCGGEADVLRGRPTGMIRVSLGPSNVKQDVDFFVSFIKEFFVELNAPSLIVDDAFPQQSIKPFTAPFVVDTLMVYPIKSCSGWAIPYNKRWKIYSEGLAWDREWCLILTGSGAVMSQKRYPRMALIRPIIDLDEGLLRISYADNSANIPPIDIPLYLDPESSLMMTNGQDVKICGDGIAAKTYHALYITDFFTRAMGIACHLGRFPSGGTLTAFRNAKPYTQSSRLNRPRKASSENAVFGHREGEEIPILLSNESPVLMISQSSLNRLNEQIKMNGGKSVHAEAFRANILLSEVNAFQNGGEKPFAEDKWRMMRIGTEYFELLGPCQRCQMVCIDQSTGQRSQEPFITLAKTRRIDGKVLFGQHSRHVPRKTSTEDGDAHVVATIAVGDSVYPAT